MGTHPRALSESYPMDSNMTGFRGFSKFLVLGTKVASALEGLIQPAPLIRIIMPKRHKPVNVNSLLNLYGMGTNTHCSFNLL